MLFPCYFCLPARLRLLFIGCLLVLLRPLPHAVAQTTPPALRQKIDLIPSDWQRGKNGKQFNFSYTLGTDPEPRNAGFFGQRLRREIVNQGGMTAEIAHSLDSYRRRKWFFLIERGVFVGSIAAYGAMVASNDLKYFEPNQRVVLGVAAASLLANIFITRTTNLHIQHAVTEYQADLVPQHGRLWQRLQPDFGGFVPQRGGVAVAVGWTL